MDSEPNLLMQNKDFFPELNDDELVSLSQNKNSAAFAALLERHYSACLKLATSILRDRTDAEDEVQNACWKAYEHIGQFHQDAKFSTWMTRIVVNQCLMRLRRARRAKFSYIDEISAEEPRAFNLRACSISPESAVGDAEVRNLLTSEIRGIPPLLRKVFVMRDIEQRPMQDVAEALGISVPAAKSRLLRARLELRQRLQKHLGRLGPATLLHDAPY